MNVKTFEKNPLMLKINDMKARMKVMTLNIVNKFCVSNPSILAIRTPAKCIKENERLGIEALPSEVV